MHLAVSLTDPLGQLQPLAEIGLSRGKPELLADEGIEALLLQRRGDEIEVGDVLVRDHRAGVDVREEGDLLADVGRERPFRTRNDDVRVDTDAAELVDRMLRRLGLELSRRVDERDERHVQVADVLGAGLAPELPHRFEERQRLDVADRATDLRDDDVAVARLRGTADPLLDLVRDVRDHLHGRAEILAAALLADHPFPDRTGGVIRVPRKVLVDEALVVADVEIGLSNF